MAKRKRISKSIKVSEFGRKLKSGKYKTNDFRVVSSVNKKTTGVVSFKSKADAVKFARLKKKSSFWTK